MKAVRPLILGYAILAHVGFPLLIMAGQLGWAVLTLFLSHASLLYPTLYPYSQWLGPVITRFRSGGKRDVWITIDDGPDHDETPKLLDLLDRHGAKATFFVIGDHAAEHPDLIHLILEAGHQIGNHTQTHPERTFWRLLPGQLRREIGEAQQTLTRLTGGQAPSLFRSPTGMKNLWVHPILKKHQLPLVCWSARGLDGVERDTGRIVERLTRGISPGAILLLHEGRGTAPVTLAAVLERLDMEGYACVVPSPDSFVTGRRKTIR